MHEHEGLICKTAISGKIAKFVELGKTWHGPHLGQAQQQKEKNGALGALSPRALARLEGKQAEAGADVTEHSLKGAT